MLNCMGVLSTLNPRGERGSFLDLIKHANVSEFCGKIRLRLLGLSTIPEIISCSRSSLESRVLQFFPAFFHSPTAQKRFFSVMCFF